MTDPTPQQESLEELTERVRQEFYVNLNPIAGDEALECLISSERIRLLDEVREKVYFAEHLKMALERKTKTAIAYNRAVDDVISQLLKALDTLGEQK